MTPAAQGFVVNVTRCVDRGGGWDKRLASASTILTTPHLSNILALTVSPITPYGRPIVGPAVHSSVFLLGLIQDLRRAIANVGLSRTDYSLDAEELLKLIDRNPDIAGDDDATAQFITSEIEKIKSVLAGIDVDSDYVHLSTVKVNYATNPMTVNLNGLDTVLNTLQRNVVNGFKGISALLNILDSTTETHIRSQLEYFVSALQSLQNEVASMLSQFL